VFDVDHYIIIIGININTINTHTPAGNTRLRGLAHTYHTPLANHFFVPGDEDQQGETARRRRRKKKKEQQQ
jgi:hypothetical protein